jgi:DNA topoisomerase-1
LPKGANLEALTLDEAVAALAAKASGAVPGAMVLGDHPNGGAVTVRSGRFGPYVNWGKVNANIPKSISPETITLMDALELLAEREGKPMKAAKPAKAPTATKKTTDPAAETKAPARKAVPPKKKAPAKKAAAKKPAAAKKSA